MESRQLTRPALGTIASLGDLYDATTDTFCGQSILTKPIPSHLIESIENPSINLQFLHSETEIEKFGKLNISGGTALNILAGLIPLGVFGKYITDEQVSDKVVKASLLYSIGTTVEKLRIHQKELDGYIATSALTSDSLASYSATHVVCQIDWGAKVVITVESAAKDKSDLSEIKTGLKATLSKLAGSITSVKLKAKAEIVNGSTAKEINFALKVFGDILPDELPQNAEEALKFLRSVPERVKCANDGKGKPVSYGLTPISVLQKRVGLPQTSQLSHELSEPFILRQLNILTELNDLLNDLNHLHTLAKNNEMCLRKEELSQVTNCQKEFELSVLGFKITLKELLLQIRKGVLKESNKPTGNLDFIDQARKFMNPNGIGSIVRDKIERVKNLRRNGVKHIGRDQSLDGTALELQEAYVLFYNDDALTKDGNIWSETKLYFYELTEMYISKDQIFYCVDTDIVPTRTNNQDITIRHYKRGKCICENVYQDYCDKKDIPITGVFKLTDNGNFGEYLTAIGIGGIYYYAVINSWLTVSISEKNGRYTIVMAATAGTSSQTFKLDDPFGEVTTDKWNSMSTVSRKLNKLIQEQTLSNPEKSKRLTTREFTKDEMKVTLTANGVTATRIFKRIR